MESCAHWWHPCDHLTQSMGATMGTDVDKWERTLTDRYPWLSSCQACQELLCCFCIFVRTAFCFLKLWAGKTGIPGWCPRDTLLCTTEKMTGKGIFAVILLSRGVSEFLCDFSSMPVLAH